MDLDELLKAFDRTSANLAKLQAIWDRAIPFIPSGPQRGSHPEYDNLRRAWKDLLPGLPLVDGWTICDELPDIDELGQSFLDYADIGESPFSAYEAGEKPGKDLDEYRYRLDRARRRAARERLEELTGVVDRALARVVSGVARDSQQKLSGIDVDQVSAAIKEIDRLIGGSTSRQGRWSDLHRHLYFGEGHDWHDIKEFDWPDVRRDVDAASHSDADPLPVPNLDLGVAAAGKLTGTVTTGLAWEQLDDDGFERLLYDLLRDFPEHQNVQWLMRTRAADRGRDLSLDRTIRDSTGSVRTERIIVQAKHWLTKSVRPGEISDTVAGTKLWQPPVVRVLIIATSGRFSADAVSWAEKHNDEGQVPYIELWPESRLETLLAQKPHIAAAHGLR